eukprot:6756605-Karenia_brevis.AAC.1
MQEASGSAPGGVPAMQEASGFADSLVRGPDRRDYQGRSAEAILRHLRDNRDLERARRGQPRQ